MGDIVDIETSLPHETYEGMCVKCLWRGLIVIPLNVPLKNVECETCGPGYVIMTGQSLEDR